MLGTLDDVKVLDLGQYISGPYCTKMLADYGAHVVKVEPPGAGDPARRIGPFPDDVPHPEKSGLFLHLNMNKKGITLDISSHDGADILRQLVREADILVENFPPSYLPSLGLSYADLESVNPRLVMTSVTPFGQTGPYRDYKATEMGVFAMSGRMYAHGLPEREPLRYAPDISWFQAGATAAVAAMGALLVSSSQGVGQHVDVSAVEALAGNADNRPLHYAYSGVEAGRSYSPGGYPVGAFPCRDGYVVFGVINDLFFHRLCHAMDRADLLEDPRFAEVEVRSQHLDELEPIFMEWLLQHTRREIFAMCQSHRVLCSPVFSPDELLEDPQLKAREFFVDVEHPEAGTLTYPGLPIKMSGTPGKMVTPAPLLGEHNVEVYRGRLGYSKRDLASLRYAGII